jgi:hypothetical protein
MNDTLDVSATLAPNSEQLDAVDLLGGERTFTIERATVTNAEQPVNLYLADFPRPWRPGKSMRRVLAYCWGKHASEWIGRSVTLYCDPNVRFGPSAVGGTRIKALSHIDGVKKIPLLVSQGKSAIYTVEPLTEAPATKPDPAAALVAHFASTLNVTRQQLEAHLARPMDEWTGEQLAALKELGGDLKAGRRSVADVFGEVGE